MDWLLAGYLLTSIVIAVLVYAARFVVRFDWFDPKNDELRPHVMRGDTDGLHRWRPATAGEAAALVVAVAWLAGVLVGSAVLPALASRLDDINAANVGLLIVAGLVWGAIFARLAVTATIVTTRGLLPLAILGVVAYFIVAFAMGGPQKVNATVVRWMDASGVKDLSWPGTDAQMRVDERIVKNLCAIGLGLAEVGDFDRVRWRCDKDHQPGGRKALAAELALNQSTRNEFARWESDFTASVAEATRALLSRHPEVAQAMVPAGAEGLSGLWHGSTSCGAATRRFRLFVDPDGAHAVLLVAEKKGLGTIVNGKAENGHPPAAVWAQRVGLTEDVARQQLAVQPEAWWLNQGEAAWRATGKRVFGKTGVPWLSFQNAGACNPASLYAARTAADVKRLTTSP